MNIHNANNNKTALSTQVMVVRFFKLKIAFLLAHNDNTGGKKSNKKFIGGVLIYKLLLCRNAS